MERKSDWQSNPSDLAALGHLPLHKGGILRIQRESQRIGCGNYKSFFKIENPICSALTRP